MPKSQSHTMYFEGSDTYVSITRETYDLTRLNFNMPNFGQEPGQDRQEFNLVLKPEDRRFFSSLLFKLDAPTPLVDMP